MMTYLCEIGCEEIPARFIPPLCRNLEAQVRSIFGKQQLSFETVTVYGTPRRIALFVTGLPDKQNDIRTTIKGPPTEIALGQDRQPLAPALGFAKKVNLSVDQLSTTIENGKEYLLAVIESKGKPIAEILSQLMGDVLAGLDLPIAMKWGAEQVPFIRPIHWILSLLDHTVIPFDFHGIQAGNQSYGHRFLTQNHQSDHMASGKMIVIPSINDYIPLLKAHFVLVDPALRRSEIKNFLNCYLTDAEIDPELLEEVIYLVEYPTGLMGAFDPQYLEIPQEVLIQCMKKNQKFFPVFKNGKMTEQFIVIAENVTPTSQQNIIKGNEQVLKARLEDAAFFWREDRSIGLVENVEKLRKIVFQKNLGSIFDKTMRIQKLADYLTEQLQFQIYRDSIVRTAYLCKADLVSHMVFELPALQGTMGMIYARIQGENDLVCQGIFDHYLPRFTNDRLPQTPTGIVVGLADKMDTLASCFYNGLMPTGTQDPLGLRRAASGIIQILLEQKINLQLFDFTQKAFELLGEPKNFDKCLDFLGQRLKNGFLEYNLPHDIIQAVFGNLSRYPLHAFQMANTLVAFRTQQANDMKLLAETAVRVKRLVNKQSVFKPIDEQLFNEAEERLAYGEYKLLHPQIQAAIQHQQFELAVQLLVKLSQSLSGYFDKVLVMHLDEAVRCNRLSFLMLVHQTFFAIADFETIII